MSWHRIDERREISTDFVTCAEYQLFLDEKYVQSEYRQPDHWDDYLFPKGCALEPILGVRAEDADRFCEWLSQRQGNKFRYRLPMLEEVSNHPTIVEREIGCWCAAERGRFIYGFNFAQWKEFFFNSLNTDWDQFLRGDRDLALDLALDRDRALALALALDLALTLDRDRDRDLALALALDRARARDLALTRALARDLDRDLDLDRDRARALDRALDRARARARDRFFTSEDLSALRSLCCILIFLWALDSHSNPKLVWYKRLWSKQTEADSTRGIEQGLDTALSLYAFFLLIDERRKGNLPAWESIRIVRERLE